MRTDVNRRVTDQIVSELEKGVRPWMKPWNADKIIRSETIAETGEEANR
jgi:antirestriction protein ArdC